MDGPGLLLCPGFIDLHTHSALRTFDDPFLTPKLAQGFTTEVINPDGLAPAPVDPARRSERQAYLRPLEGPGPEEWPWSTVAEYLDALDTTRPALSLVPSIGHGAVRDVVLGGGRVDPTAEQLRAMRREVRLGLDAGARMLSFGLVYLPGAYAATGELVAVAEEAARAGVPLVPHVRNEGHGLLAAVDEMIDVARRSGAPLHLSHLKSLADERLVEPLLELLDGRRGRDRPELRPVPLRRGQHAAREHPARLGAGGRRERDAPVARQPRRAATDRPRHRRRPARLGEPPRHPRAGPHRDRERRAAERGRRREDAGGDRRDPRQRSGRGSARPDGGVGPRRDDGAPLRLRRRRARRSPPTGCSSSAPTASSARGRIRASSPPRRASSGGSALREGLLPVEEAVARLTARAADRLGLSDRGRIAPGKRADLVLLDPAAYVDTATYADPLRSPEGVAGVWVAGARGLAGRRADRRAPRRRRPLIYPAAAAVAEKSLRPSSMQVSVSVGRASFENGVCHTW